MQEKIIIGVDFGMTFSDVAWAVTSEVGNSVILSLTYYAKRSFTNLPAGTGSSCR